MDVIGSSAFGLELNSFKEPDSPFIKHWKRAVNLTSYERALELFSRSFPKLAEIFHVTLTPTEPAIFFSEVVKKTVSHRENTKISRNDLLQLLINLKNEGKQIQIHGKT